MVASFVAQAWIARRFERVGLGEYHATGLFVIVIVTIALVGLPIGASQRIASLSQRGSAHARPAKETAFALAAVLGLILAVVGFAIWPWFAWLFGINARPAEWLTAAALAGAAISNFAVHMALAELRMATVALLVLSQPLGVTAGIALTYGGLALDGAHLAAIGFLASGATSIARLLGDGLLPRFHGSELRRLIRSSMPAAVVLYPKAVTGWVDRTIIGVVVGPSALGAFVAASALVEALQRVARGVGSFSVPAYALLAGDPVAARRVLESQLRITSAVFLIASSVFLAAGSAILGLIFGEGFAIAATTLRLLAVALLPLGVALVVATHSVGLDPLRVSSRILLLLIPLHVVVGVVLTVLFSIAGTALAELVVWSVGAQLYVAQAWRNGAIALRPLLHIAAVGAPVLVASWYVGLQPLAWPLRAGISLLLALPPILLVLIREEERRVLQRLASRAGTLHRDEARG